MSDIKVYECTVQNGKLNNLPEDVLEKCIGMYCVAIEKNKMSLYTKERFEDIARSILDEDSCVSFCFFECSSVVTDREALVPIILNSCKCESSRAIIRLRVLECLDSIEIRVLSREE